MKIDIRKVGKIKLGGQPLTLTPSFVCYQKIFEETGKTVSQIAVEFSENPTCLSPMSLACIVWASQWEGIKTEPKHDIEYYGNLIMKHGYNKAYNEVLSWLFGSISGWDNTVSEVEETEEEKKS